MVGDTPPPSAYSAPADTGEVKRRIGKPLDLALAAAAVGTRLGDWSQSLDIARRGFSEQSPLLGKHPSEGRVNTVAGLLTLGTLGLTQIKNPTLRRGALGMFTAAELYAMLKNHKAGVRFNLP